MTIAGISHVSLTVSSLDTARQFWVDVMGFAAKVEQPGLLIVAYPAAAVMIACVVHEERSIDSFDERRVGLDHLALDVADLDALRTWETAFAAANVKHTPIVESPFGWHLNVRAPDDIAVELLVMTPETRAALAG